MGVTPCYRLIANDNDITALITERMASLQLSDESGSHADTLEVVLADHLPNAPLKLPPMGAELELALGYDGQLRPMGVFVCSEITLSGWPATMTLRAHAAPWEGTPKGKSDLQTQKTRSWPAGTTLGAMLSTMAAEHGMTWAISPSLTGVALPHIDQTEESDINVLLRLAQRYDAIAKPAGGRLIFAKRGEAKSVTGIDMPRITLTPDEIASWQMTYATRDSPGTVIAFYRMARRAELHQVSVGDGHPVHRIKQYLPDAAAAIAAARGELSRRARAETKLTLEMAGRAELSAEAVLTLNGWREGVNGDWLVTRVQHGLDKNGYRCSIEAERPNNHPDVAAAINTQVRDQVVRPSRTHHQKT
ncbi:phage tail protein [Xylella fastidiosa subsp. fastidiosa]|uniref:Phage-related tail protein n=2 Tax=Xylella fastidiosa TaxID=2371 RepID=Q87CI2_XYLFT|nr:phage late control D family protein [Xylella fastidiosa]AAO28943.1 phage-related tail protein [Xylella fastidiosa Temecula1]ACB92580.1 late control D family protein [Xylella fastidiosa M23]MBE0263063.1 phage late control D family protein [Xylella fastidiosa subsp. fastidiosa]MBE0265251.1 phage late control D family protein [Xylella fastidiosa subsp. fastidiosa]MBE0267545.1 phage late control D family protein [Xylella fastidiosa subsp. fastidiosa]